MGDQLLEAVTTEEIDVWYEHLVATNSDGVPRPVYMTVRSMFAAAVKQRMLDVSPVKVDGADRVRPVRSESRILSRAEAERLAAAMVPRYRLAVWVGLWCGLRRAEIIGLKVGDFDLDSRLLHVERQVVTSDEGETRRKSGERRAMMFAPPKYGSNRTVGVPAFLVDIVKEHMDMIARPIDPETRIFPGRCATGTIHPNRLGEAFNAAAIDAHLPGFTPHSMRHTALTWVAQVGATTHELMGIAGHRSPQVAMTYQHRNGERQRQIADLMAV